MSASAVKVQEKTAAIGAGVQTFAATFDAACTAGNLIVWVAAVDANSGTTTQPTDTPNLPIELKSNDVSLLLAWGVADGGETTISGSVSGANTAGGRVWLFEVADPGGVGAWARRGTTTIFTTSGGATSANAVITATPTITEGGFGIAAATWDAVAAAGTASWSNSWVKDFDGAAGTAVDMWTATKAGIAAGGTESTTLTRTGGTAEQYQALLVVFGKPAGVNAVLAATLQKPVAALTGTSTVQGQLGATLQLPIGALQGSPIDRGQLAASVPLPVAALAGQVRINAQLAATLPPPIANLAGVVPAVGQLQATLPLPRMWIHEALPELVTPLRAGTPDVAPLWTPGSPTHVPGWTAGPPDLG